MLVNYHEVVEKDLGNPVYVSILLWNHLCLPKLKLCEICKGKQTVVRALQKCSEGDTVYFPMFLLPLWHIAPSIAQPI